MPLLFRTGNGTRYYAFHPQASDLIVVCRGRQFFLLWEEMLPYSTFFERLSREYRFNYVYMDLPPTAVAYVVEMIKYGSSEVPWVYLEDVKTVLSAWEIQAFILISDTLMIH